MNRDGLLWQSTLDEWDKISQPERWLDDPTAWAQQRLGVTLWSLQSEILLSVRNNRRTAVRSCHGAGKSFTAAIACCWWIDTHEPGEAFVVTTAPTHDQVKAILWREIGRAHKKGGLVGHTNLTEWYAGGEIVGMGRKPNDYEPTAFQGIHAPYVLVVKDEACGIPEPLWDAASTLASNEDSRQLAIGNPDDPNSHFAKVCKPGSGWNSIKISAYDTPNFTGEEVPQDVSRSLVSKMWVVEKTAEWGEGSALLTSKVHAEFPENATDTVVMLSHVQRCREIDTDQISASEEPVELGADIGAGGDRTVITERRGHRVGRVWVSRHDDPMQCVGEIVQAIHETGASAVKIDVIGVGWGVAGRLHELYLEGVHKAQVVKVNVGLAPDKEFAAKFANLRAQMWWEVGREASRKQEWDLSAISDECAAELCAPRYALNSKGQILVESKDDMKKRIKKSPDLADSLLLAFYKGKVVRASRSYGSTIAAVRVPGVRNR